MRYDYRRDYTYVHTYDIRRYWRFTLNIHLYEVEKFVIQRTLTVLYFQYLDDEFQWWYTKRMVDVVKDGKTYKMARYNASSCTPRPESY